MPNTSVRRRLATLAVPDVQHDRAVAVDLIVLVATLGLHWVPSDLAS